MIFDVLITRLRTWFNTDPGSEFDPDNTLTALADNRRPAPARMTTPDEHAPLYAAYAAARRRATEVGYEYDLDAPTIDDSVIQAAIDAYEKAKTGRTAVTPRPAAPTRADLIEEVDDLNPIPYTHINLAVPDRSRALGSWLRHVGDHTAYRRDRRGTYNVALPREIANEIENLLIHIEGTNRATGTNINALRRILSDAIQAADDTTWRIER